MKILIFGASGFLGTKLKDLFLKEGHKVIGVDSQGNSDFKIDATNFKEVSNFLKKEKYDFVIDAIGLTSSSACEKNPSKALLLNYKVAKNISEYFKKTRVPVIFISSSYVFNGLKGNYSEEEETNPLNEYGKTKVMAEKEILKLNRGIVIRVDILYGFNGMNKPNGIFQKVLSGEKIVVNSPGQIRQPLFVDDLPKIILFLIKNQRGIFHIAGPDKITMERFIIFLSGVLRRKIKIIKKGENLVKIPKNSTLNTSKISLLELKTTSLNNAKSQIKKQIISEQP